MKKDEEKSKEKEKKEEIKEGFVESSVIQSLGLPKPTKKEPGLLRSFGLGGWGF